MEGTTEVSLGAKTVSAGPRAARGPGAFSQPPEQSSARAAQARAEAVLTRLPAPRSCPGRGRDEEGGEASPRAEAALGLPPAWPGAMGERQGGEGSGGRRGAGPSVRLRRRGRAGSGRGRPGQPFVPRGAPAPQPRPPRLRWGSGRERKPDRPPPQLPPLSCRATPGAPTQRCVCSYISALGLVYCCAGPPPWF